MRPIAGTNRTHREVQVPKLLLRNSHWVDNLCQCESIGADPPGNQRLRTDSDSVGIQERYVSAAGWPAGQRKGHNPRAVGRSDQAPEGVALPACLGAGEVGLPLG